MLTLLSCSQKATSFPILLEEECTESGVTRRTDRKYALCQDNDEGDGLAEDD